MCVSVWEDELQQKQSVLSVAVWAPPQTCLMCVYSVAPAPRLKCFTAQYFSMPIVLPVLILLWHCLGTLCSLKRSLGSSYFTATSLFMVFYSCTTLSGIFHVLPLHLSIPQFHFLFFSSPLWKFKSWFAGCFFSIFFFILWSPVFSTLRMKGWKGERPHLSPSFSALFVRLASPFSHWPLSSSAWWDLAARCVCVEVCIFLQRPQSPLNTTPPWLRRPSSTDMGLAVDICAQAHLCVSAVNPLSHRLIDAASRSLEWMHVRARACTSADLEIRCQATDHISGCLSLFESAAWWNVLKMSTEDFHLCVPNKSIKQQRAVARKIKHFHAQIVISYPSCWQHTGLCKKERCSCPICSCTLSSLISCPDMNLWPYLLLSYFPDVCVYLTATCCVRVHTRWIMKMSLFFFFQDIYVLEVDRRLEVEKLKGFFTSEGFFFFQRLGRDQKWVGMSTVDVFQSR